MSDHDPISAAAARLLRPLVRVMIARGVAFPVFSDWVKRAYLAAASRHFGIDGKRLTDSRLHVLTGLQRKDIKALRAEAEAPDPVRANPVARAIGLWLADHAPGGVAAPLPLRGAAPSFEALIAGISRDIHPRTVQDELTRQGIAVVEDDRIRLTAQAYLPADDAALMDYFGANTGDHAAAAAENLANAPESAPHFDRAVHYNHLTAASAAELDAMARELFGAALQQLNARAAALQAQDLQTQDSQNQGLQTEMATRRVRLGAYTYGADQEDRS